MHVRLVVSRIAAVALLAPLLVVAHAWPEQSGVDLALADAGLVLLLVGCVGRIWCAAHIAGRKDAELVTEGPFSICRNPLYLFSLCAFLGVGLSFESLVATAAFAALFCLTHLPAIRREERNLAARFGDAYGSYVNRVPRLMPNLGLYVPARALTISAPAFTRTLVEAALIPLAYLGAQGIEAAQQAGLLPVLAHVY